MTSSGRHGAARAGRGIPGATALLAALCTSACGLSRAPVPAAYVSQLLADPIAYHGKAVRLEGSVEAVNDAPGEPSTYTLSDASGDAIRVRARGLPEVGAQLRVLGQVAQDEGNVLTPVIIEGRRMEPAGSPVLLYLALLLAASFSFSLVVADALLQNRTALAAGATQLLPFAASDPDAIAPAVVEPRDYRDGDRLTFHVLTGTDRGKRFVVERRRAYIGRGGGRRNDVDLTDATVSRRQAVVAYSQKREQVVLINEAETNPTAVNGKSLGKGHIRHGDVLKAGHVSIQVLFEPGPARPPASPPSSLPSPMDPPPTAPPPPAPPSPAAAPPVPAPPAPAPPAPAPAAANAPPAAPVAPPPAPAPEEGGSPTEERPVPASPEDAASDPRHDEGEKDRA